VYSKYTSGIFQGGCGVECDIICYVKIIVTLRDSAILYNETQPAKATEYGNIPRRGTNTEQLGNRE
jgi:hypothetical protein